MAINFQVCSRNSQSTFLWSLLTVFLFLSFNGMKCSIQGMAISGTLTETLIE